MSEKTERREIESWKLKVRSGIYELLYTVFPKIVPFGYWDSDQG